MKHQIVNSSVFFVILAAFMLLVVQSVTYGETTVSMSPSSVAPPAVGGQLTFSINITGGMDVASFSVCVTFDSTALSYVSIASGGYLVNPVAGGLESTSSNVQFGEATLAGGTDGFVIGANGGGTLATVTFRVVAVKDSTVGLSAILANSRYNAIGVTVRGARVSTTATETGGTPTTNTGPPPPPPPTQTELVRISGDDQEGLPGKPLADPFVVQVLDEDGDPFEGATVKFSVLLGGGSLSARTPTTDADGQAESILTLGTALGTNKVQVNVEEISQVLVFSAEATTTPSVLTVLSIISGDNQSGLTGETLTNPFVVEVRDESANPLGNVTVNFAVLTGGGTLSATTGTTDANGQAESMLTLGSEPGTNTVEASVEGLSQTVVFNAEATLPPPIPTTLEGISGDNQNGLTGEVLANPFVVEVRDQNSDLMEGVTVTFTVNAGGGSLNDTSVEADANGLAQSTLTLGSEPGTNTVEASVEGLSQTVVFNAEATLPPPIPTTLSIVSGGEQDGPTDETDSFVVQVLDQDGNPLEDVTVTFTILGDDGSMSTTTVMPDENRRAEFTLPLDSDPGTYTITVSSEGIAATVTFTVVVPLEFDLSLPAGLSLIHVPLKVTAVDVVAKTIKSVSDLYDVLGGADNVNWLITYDSESQDWRSYFGDSDRGMVADKMLTNDTGILASIKTPVSVRLGGDVLGTDGMSTITLNQGLNLVGLPLKDSSITRVSDLFALEGIADNVPVIIVSDNGEFKAVERAGDPGDIEITGGQSFILTAKSAATVAISGDAWDNTATSRMAAPLMMRGIQTTGITPVLALNGSIVDGVNGINSAGLHVIVKNFSTGSAVTTVIGDAGSTSSQGSYRLTVVDIKGGRAAAIGDALEISVKSPDTSIGVQPLRYTVTAEDVKRSRIQLPALVLQELPSETELLRNYPNPFNPETWIPYRLAEDAFVTLTIYNGSGQVVRTLDIGHQVASIYESRSKAAYWDGRNDIGESVASGVYFYTLTAGDFSATRKMLILK